jgi:plasmid stability protein
MATITVKNIPNALYEQLKQTAQLHRRSINSEIIVCIEQAIGGQPIDLEMTLARAQVLREKTSAYPINDDAFNEAKTAGRA